MQAMKDAVVNSRGSFFVWMQERTNVWIDIWFMVGVVTSREFKDVSKMPGPDS